MIEHRHPEGRAVPVRTGYVIECRGCAAVEPAPAPPRGYRDGDERERLALRIVGDGWYPYELRQGTAGPFGCDPCDRCARRPADGEPVWQDTYGTVRCDPCVRALVHRGGIVATARIARAWSDDEPARPLTLPPCAECGGPGDTGAGHDCEV